MLSTLLESPPNKLTTAAPATAAPTLAIPIALFLILSLNSKLSVTLLTLILFSLLESLEKVFLLSKTSFLSLEAIAFNPFFEISTLLLTLSFIKLSLFLS